jgi:hypothetical protein
MLIGRFGNTSGAPYLEASVVFPRLRVRGLVSFLVDTGADATVFMPADSTKIGVNFKSLKTPTITAGIGGTAQGFSEQVLLSFSDHNYLYSYLLKVEIAAPTPHNLRFPSLLGRDILKQWRFVMDAKRQQVTFTPRTWDLRQKI